MKLCDKIYYLRKKNALSQEELADKLGVSRQSVSKWECGSALPEIDKLSTLAATFGVSVDWLLSEEDPADGANTEAPDVSAEEKRTYPEWMDHVPGFIGGLIKRFGWIVGVYVTVIGGLFMGMGALTKLAMSFMTDMVSSTTSSMVQGMDGLYFDGGLFNEYVNASTNMVKNSPINVIANIELISGAIIAIVGIVLIVILRKYSKK